MDNREKVELQALAKEKSRSERRYDIDWIRIIAVLLLIYGHTACIFGYPTWQINNTQRSGGMTQFMFFTSLWHMPLLFLLSGMGTAFALGFRRANQYVKERVYRLLIPLIFGMLVLIPLQVYYEHLNKLSFQGSYLKFYPYYFEQAYSHKDVDWHHLWFLGYLFMCSGIALPLFLYLKQEAGQRFTQRLAYLCQRSGAIFLFAIPLAITEVTL
jgi:fucose 4-O-acetylase-like acetyltransferase